MDAYPREAWLRLGKHLKQRRPQIDPRYRIRRVFAEANDLTDKTVQEIENAYRETFSDVMLAAVERAYQLKAGGIERFLAGGELEPREPTGQSGVIRPGDSSPPTQGVRVEQRDRHLRLEVTVDTDASMDEAIDRLGRLSPIEEATVATLKNMRFEPAEVAGAVLILRGYAARHAQQDNNHQREA